MYRKRIVALAISLLPLTVAPATAEMPVLHHVKYTVTSETPTHAKIYYRDTDPPSWADYSHNPYLYSPRAEADIGPGQVWVFETMLADPQQWAMVTATSGLAPVTPMFGCELAVDGVVVTSNYGPKGALCALRHW
jgi:hypothetical protein